MKNNRFGLLSKLNSAEEQKSKPISVPKPPPIFHREVSYNAIVKILTELIVNNNFHIVPLRKNSLHEAKIASYTEEHYRKVSNYLTENKKNFYTYQLKSSKGLQVVIKGIDSSVESMEVKEALEDLGYSI